MVVSLKMVLFLFFYILSLHECLAATATRQVSVLVGSSIAISCQSTLSPSWQWRGSKDNERILALSGVNVHPNLDEPRYSFSKQETKFSILISKVKIEDAGTFICVGDNYVKTVLIVLR